MQDSVRNDNGTSDHSACRFSCAPPSSTVSRLADGGIVLRQRRRAKARAQRLVRLGEVAREQLAGPHDVGVLAA